MSTFDYLKPAEAVAAARDDAPDYRRIIGLKAVDADRIPNLITRTRAGNARQPEQPWRAHGHLELFKEIARVEWVKDTRPSGVAVLYTDGTTEFLYTGDLLCVERPVTSPKDGA